MGKTLKNFNQLWVIDFEFISSDGERPSPICLVGEEVYSGRVEKIWLGGCNTQSAPPFLKNSNSLIIAYYASAEMGCFLSLGWEMPTYLLDLYTEFRNTTNGLSTLAGNSLLGALKHFGLQGIASNEKESMRDLVLSGGPWTANEKEEVLNYCQTDVEATGSLFTKMAPDIDLPRALLRGRYMKAVAIMEYNGVPIDAEMLQALKSNWGILRNRLVEEVDKNYGIYEGLTFKQDLFEEYLHRNGIHWPRLETNRLNLQDDTFKDMAKKHPQLQPLRELRSSLSQLRLNNLAVGSDARNRCLLSPFSSKTSRNQPSNAKFIFGPAVWLRFLIKPKPGMAIAYIDWSQQEFGIAAALSGDQMMQEAYLSGDPYLTFAKQAGAVPEDATKQSHPNERELYKACVLALQYGMGYKSLAERISQPTVKARQLIQAHKETYKDFWTWTEGALNYSQIKGRLNTVFGWQVYVKGDTNSRMLTNFPVQANGAEMLRITCIFAIEAGIKVCAPVHDAILIEAPATEIDEAVKQTQEIMEEASAIVLDGFRLRSDAEVFIYPDRYYDERGAEMWDKVQTIFKNLPKGGSAWDG